MTVTAIEPVQRRSPGRVPPHNLEAEESLLGAMLLSRDAILSASEAHVEPPDFYKPAHGHIYAAITALYAQGEPVDPVTVADELTRVDLLDNLGGRQTLLQLQAATPASANASHYAKIVNELALLRRLIAVAGDIAELGYDDSQEPHDQLDRAESLVFEIAQGQASESVSYATAVQDALDGLEAERRPGVATGYRDLDDLLLGLQPGTLVLVGARPAMGKSAFALGAAWHCAHVVGRPALLFSMEMSRRELIYRNLAGDARVPLESLHRAIGNPEYLDKSAWSKLTDAVARGAGAPLEIDDNPHCTVMDVRAKARRTKARFGDLGMIAVDYIGLMAPMLSRTSEANRNIEVAEISRGLKLLARELDCPVMALSQLNRQLEYRQDKRPVLADLRDSGAQEQDADVVVFIYREEIYDDQTEARGTAEIIVRKHRNGPTGVVRLAFLDQFTKFANMARL